MHDALGISFETHFMTFEQNVYLSNDFFCNSILKLCLIQNI